MGGPTQRRQVYAIAYLFMALAGIFAVIWPAKSVSQAAASLNVLIVMWAVFLIAGGVSAMLGAMSDRWLGEYAGLPLLSSVFAIYGISALAFAPATGWTSTSGGAAFIAIAALFMARWVEVNAVRREALRRARANVESPRGGRPR